MKITFDPKNTEQLELIKAMGSKDILKAAQAQEALAALLSPIVSEQYNVAGTSQILYKTFTYSEDTNPSLALSLLTGKDEGWLSVWSQAMPGAVPTNTVTVPVDEFPLQAYRLDTAISYLKKWAAKSRLDVIQLVVERLFQEVLLKSEDNAWAVALAAIVGATNPQTTNLGNVRHTQTAGSFILDDLNKAFTAFRRQYASWAGGTTNGGNYGMPTDMIMSPEQMERIRSFAYEPVNSKGANFTTAAADTGVIGLPEADRRAMFNGGMVPSFFGVDITVIDELGAGQRYNNLFGNYIGSTAIPTIASGGGSTDTFAASTDDLILLVDASKEFAWKGIATDAETGSTLTLVPDDQFLKRSEKIGLYGSVQETRAVTETRSVIALMV